MNFVWAAIFCIVAITHSCCEDIEVASTKSDLPASKNPATGDVEDRDRLFKRLFDTYDKRNYPSNTTVKFGLAVININIEEHKRTLEADTWFRMVWDDKRLVWDQSEFNLDVLRVPNDQVWKPDITLYNSANPAEMAKCWPSNILVYNTGKVLWVPPCHLSAYCNLTLHQAPYGDQHCSLKFGSWTFDGYSADLQFYDDKKSADLSDYAGVSDWKITSNTAVREETHYACCPEPYVSVTYNFTIQRKSESNLGCQKR